MLLLAAGLALLSFVSAQPEKVVVGYYPGWAIYDRSFWVYEIDASKLSHVNYAFADVGTDHRLQLIDPWADIQIPYPGDDPHKPIKGNIGALHTLRQQYPHLKIMISIGGWTLSGRFSNAALTEQTRRTFAASCVDWIQRYGFDGIDVDWEYPVEGGVDSNIRRPEDGVNYTLLLAEIRRQLDNLSKTTRQHHPLTIAAPANPLYYRHYELNKLDGILDFINVMCYDYNGAWDITSTGMNAPLYPDPADTRPTRDTWNGAYTINGYIQAGVRREKVILGVPFYGRGWSGVPSTNNGLYQPGTGPSPGSWEPGVLDWTDIRDNYIGRNGYVRHFHPPTNTTFTYSSQTGVWVTYDDPETIEIKGRFARDMNIGGAMVWDLSSDKGDELLLALHKGLGGIIPTPIPGCPNCVPGSFGPCQHASAGDNTCYPLLPNGDCPPGTVLCKA